MGERPREVFTEMGRSSIEAGFQPSPVFEQQVALSTGDAITLFIHERERDRQRKGSTGLFDQATRQPPVRLHPVRFRKRRPVFCVNQPLTELYDYLILYIL